MSVSAILPRHIFGCRGDIRDGLHAVDENTVLFPAGHALVLQHVELRTQRYISCTQEAESVCALAVAPSKKHVAVAERADRATITVYDLQSLKRRKVLTFPESKTKEITSLAFSLDSRLLAVQGGGPDWNLTVWAWERAKALGSMRTAEAAGNLINQVKFSPGGSVDSNLVTVCGSGVFRALRAEDMGLRIVQHSLSKRDTTNFTAHAWMQGEVLAVGTEAGELFIADGTDLKATLDVPSPKEGIEAITPHGKAFVAATVKGNVWQYEKQEDGSYRCINSLLLAEGQALRALLPLPEDWMLALSSAGQLHKFGTASGKNKAVKVKPLVVGGGSHTGDVVGLSGCMRKPFIATAAADRTLRLWNVNDRNVEMAKSFAEEPFSVALHPNGFMAAVGFVDKLRLFTVLMDDVRLIKEFPIRSCRSVSFSHGGHLFAAANGNTISVFNAVTCEQVGVLRGHSSKVRCLAWGLDDNFLTTTGADGAVYEWSLRDQRRVRENVIKGCSYACLAIRTSGGTIYAAGSDNKLKALEDGGNHVGLRVSVEVDTKCTVTQLALPEGGRLLFAATTHGTIRAYKLPLSDAFQELHCSNSPITQLALSPDHFQLFAGNSEGTVFVFDVKDRDPSRAAASADRRDEQLAWAEEVLVSKADLEEQHQRIAELDSQVVELELAKEYALRVKDMTAAEQANAIAAEHEREMKAQRTMLAEFQKESDSLLLERDRQMQQAHEKHQALLAAMEAHSQEKMAAASRSALEAAAETAKTAAAAEAERIEMAAAHEKVLQEIGEQLQARIKEEQDSQEALQLAKEAQEKEFEILRALMEDTTDQEIEELRAKYESKLAAEREVCMRLQGENGLMRTKFTSMAAERQQLKGEIAALANSKQDLVQATALLERDRAGLRGELKNTEVAIRERDATISALKAEVQQLAKFRQVLEYELLQVKEQVAEKEARITQLQLEMKEVEEEMQRRNQSKKLELAVADLRLQQTALRKDASRQLQDLTQARTAIRLFQRDLQEAMRQLQDPNALKAAMKAIFHKHASEAKPETTMAEDVLQGLKRQRDLLEGRLEHGKGQLRALQDQMRREKLQTLQEHSSLLNEVEILREQLKLAKSGGTEGARRPLLPKP